MLSSLGELRLLTPVSQAKSRMTRPTASQEGHESHTSYLCRISACTCLSRAAFYSILLLFLQYKTIIPNPRKGAVKHTLSSSGGGGNWNSLLTYFNGLKNVDASPPSISTSSNISKGSHSKDRKTCVPKDTHQVTRLGKDKNDPVPTTGCFHLVNYSIHVH